MYIPILLFIFKYITYHVTTGFNLDTKFPIIFEDPKRGNGGKSSYFGFTSVLDRDEEGNSWLLIGAPRSNSSEWNMNNITEPGALYQCPLSGPLESCREYLLDPTGNQDSPPGSEPYFDHKDGAWIGGAMDIHSQNGGSQVVVCGHRWINEYKYSHNSIDYLMIGVCYGLMKNMNNITMENAAKLLPLVDTKKKTSSYRNIGVYNYGQGQAGMSVHFPSNGRMIIGAPGIYNWKGSVVSYKESSPLPGGRNKRDAHLFGTAVVAKAPNMFSFFDLFGYQVSSGDFFGESLYYVASAPRGSQYKGKVIVFLMPQYSDQYIMLRQNIEGKYTGEYFGASIAVADVNGDGLDDLIVGAPTYGDDEGHIYVYYGSRTGALHEEWNEGSRTGKKGARFGTAVTSLGDLDQDGYHDIIVGAPYENGGTIYIYNGDSNGLSREPSQRIQAEDISHKIKGFGISFSRPTDFDDNKYADVAVGSFISGHTVLLRAHPVVTLSMNLSSNTAKIEQSHTWFSVTACISFTDPHVRSVSLNVTQIIEVDYIYRRGYLQGADDAIYTRTITVNKNQCDNLVIHLSDAATRELLEPFTITITYSLTDDNKPVSPIWVRNSVEGSDGFDKYVPVESKQFQKQKESISIPFVKDCGHDDVCSADLHLNCTFSDVRNDGFYVIDSSKALQLQIGVVNLGPEPAYGVKVAINFSNPLSLNNILKNCEYMTSGSTTWTAILCGVGMRLGTNQKGNLSVDFNVKDIRDVSKFLQLSVMAITKSDDMNMDNNNQNFTISLVTEADVSITGKSMDDKYTFSKTSTDMSTFTFLHIFEVQKFGRSPIDEAEVEIIVPQFYRGVKILDIYRPNAEQGNDAITCYSNITYDEYERKVVLDSDMEVIRNKRSVPDNILNETENLEETYHEVDNDVSRKTSNVTNINCNEDSHFSCIIIKCKTKPFYTSITTAKIILKMQINISDIVSLFGVKDVILLTRGHVHISRPENFTSLTNDRPDHTVVKTTFSSIEPPKNVSTFIIIVAAIVGLLLLLLLTMGLMKAGFFRRKKMEELQTLKENEIAAAQEFHYTTPNLADDNIQDGSSQQIQENDLYEDGENIKQ